MSLSLRETAAGETGGCNGRLALPHVSDSNGFVLRTRYGQSTIIREHDSFHLVYARM